MAENEIINGQKPEVASQKKHQNPAVPIIGASLRLILIGVVIWVLVDTVLLEEMALLYPYLNPGLLLGLKIYAIVGFLVPGVLLLVSLNWTKNLSENGGANLSPLVKVLIISLGALTCGSIIGIRTGIKLIMGATYKTPDQVAEGDVKDEMIKSIRLYCLAGGIYLLVFGVFFLGLQDFMQVITLDLVYPTLTQTFMIGLLIWTWACLVIPGLIFLLRSKAFKPANMPLKPTVIKSLILASVLAIFSLFGLTIGIKTIKNLKILESDLKA